jgi:hypothetical protein
LVWVEPGVAEDAREGASLELSMQRHREGRSVVGMLQPDVAAALPRDSPPRPFEGLHKALA